jgi:hypothetical protein
MKSDPQLRYEIIFSEKILLSIDHQGVQYFIPNRYRLNRWNWQGIIEGSLESISEVILRDLADNNYSTLDKRGRKIVKRSVKLDRNTICVQCGASGSIKKYFFGTPNNSKISLRLLANRVRIGRDRKKGDPESTCTSCGWSGSTEIFRFPRKNS